MITASIEEQEFNNVLIYTFLPERHPVVKEWLYDDAAVTNWPKDGAYTGTQGEGLRIEAVSLCSEVGLIMRETAICLFGSPSFYRLHD